VHVKERVTLTLDRAVTHRGKSVARTRGTSFSGFVESLLAEADWPERRPAKALMDRG
jgi:hypothetical protein